MLPIHDSQTRTPGPADEYTRTVAVGPAQAIEPAPATRGSKRQGQPPELFLSECGFELTEALCPGRFIRMPHNCGGKRSKVGWVKAFADGDGSLRYLVAGCWRCGEKFRWADRDARILTKEERKRIRAELKAAKQERETNADAAAERTRTVVETLPPAPSDHPYLVRKGVKSHGALISPKGFLVITMLNSAHAIRGAQGISNEPRQDWRGLSKSTEIGVAARGLFHPFWAIDPTTGMEDTSTVVLCEGWATAATIFEATGLTTIACFSGGNLEPVAVELRRLWSGTRFIIAADNDHQKPDGKNPGLDYGQKAADSIGAVLCWPKFEATDPGTDFNDLSIRRRDEVGRIIGEAVAKAREEEIRRAQAEAAMEGLRARFGELFLKNEKGAITAILARPVAGLIQAELSDELIFSRPDSCFFTYDKETGVFVRRSVAAMRNRVAERLLRFPEGKDQEVRRGASNVRLLDSVLAHLEGFAEEVDPFPRTRRFIHLANGVIDLESEEGPVMHPEFSPDLRSRNRSPFSWDPRSTAPRFIHELLEPAFEPDDIDALQMYCGQCLLGTNLTQTMLLVDGPGGAGKGALTTIARGIVGIENTTELRTAALDGRFETGRYFGKTLLLGPDVKPDFLSSEGAARLKGLTGGDLITGEGKNSNLTTSTPGTWNIIVTANTRLRVHLAGDATAWERRLIRVVSRNHKPKAVIPNFAELLLAEEGAGILRWMVEGALKLMEAVRTGNGRFPLTERQTENTRRILEASDSVRGFVRYGVVCQSGSQLLTEEIVAGYFAYCSELGWEPQPIRVVERQLPDLMLEVHAASNAHSIKPPGGGRARRGYRGVALAWRGGPDD